MFKALIFKFFSSFARPCHVEDWDTWDAEKDVYLQKKFNLRGSKAERMAATREWSKKENIEARLKEFEEKSEEVLERAKRMSQKIRIEMGLPLEDPPLPDSIPEDLKGQPPSTIRAMLRHRASDKMLKGSL